LTQNFPNPFNPSTQVSFHVPISAFVNLSVFDVLGCEAAVIVKENKMPGDYTVSWQANAVASGVYMCRLRLGDVVLTRKMALIR
jgi:hypothetical protein